MKIKNYSIIKFLVMKFNRYADMQKKKNNDWFENLWIENLKNWFW